jgi:hypothetical protein
MQPLWIISPAIQESQCLVNVAKSSTGSQVTGNPTLVANRDARTEVNSL